MKTPKTKPTGANRGNGEGILCSLRSLLFKAGPGGVVELDFDKSISDGVNIYRVPAASTILKRASFRIIRP